MAFEARHNAVARSIVFLILFVFDYYLLMFESSILAVYLTGSYQIYLSGTKIRINFETIEEM